MTPSLIGPRRQFPFNGSEQRLAGAGRAFPFAETVGTVHPLVDLDHAIALAAAPGAAPRIGVVAR